MCLIEGVLTSGIFAAFMSIVGQISRLTESRYDYRVYPTDS